MFSIFDQKEIGDNSGELKMSNFLIVNDVGLSIDKVNYVLNLIRSDDGFEYENLDDIDETLIEVLSHLSQAMENLGVNTNE